MGAAAPEAPGGFSGKIIRARVGLRNLRGNKGLQQKHAKRTMTDTPEGEEPDMSTKEQRWREAHAAPLRDAQDALRANEKMLEHGRGRHLENDHAWHRWEG